MLGRQIRQFRRQFTQLKDLKHAHLKDWIEANAKHLQPDEIKICDGSEQENDQLIKQMVDKKVLIPLNPKLRPNSYLCRTDPRDVARSEQATFVCTEKEQDAGPNNNWVAPNVMRQRLSKLSQGAMVGRVMYAIPFSMGPVDSPYAKFGVQLTDSPYVVASMRIMTRMGKQVLDKLGGNGEYVPCVHTVGVPLNPGVKDIAWPCDIENRVIAHFPETKEIISLKSGYGGNSLLGKKALALRIASFMGKSEGWLAEHMLILGIETPKGKKHYIVCAFPSACGKTNLAMIQSQLPGYKVTCVGDDIAWMRFNKKDGRLYAIQPEFGIFGVAPGTSTATNKNAMDTIKSNTMFTNVALTKDKDVWWEGMTKDAPSGLTDWHGKAWTQPIDKAERKKNPAAHPNSRFTAPIQQCPSVDVNWDKPQGVPIDAIVFGGRRSSLVPLVYEMFSWNHGVLTGSAVASQTTAATEGKTGQLRFDPFAMTPFCGYHFGDYFQHWVNMGTSKADGITNKKLPKMFHVNWFRQENGKFMWPGFSENMRVLKWMVQRIEGEVDAVESPIGNLPKLEDLDLSGSNLPSEEVMKTLLTVDKKGYREEVKKIRKFHQQFSDRYPKELEQELNQLEERLK